MKFNNKNYKSQIFRNANDFKSVHKILSGDLFNTLFDFQEEKENELYLSVENSAEIFTLQSLLEFISKSNFDNKEEQIEKIKNRLYSLGTILFKENSLEEMHKGILELAKSGSLEAFNNAYKGLSMCYGDIYISQLKFNITKEKFMGEEPLTEEDKVLLHLMSELAVYLNPSKFPLKTFLRDIISNRNGIDAVKKEGNEIKLIDNKLKITDINSNHRDFIYIETYANMIEDKNGFVDRGWIAKTLANEVHSIGSFVAKNNNVSKLNDLYSKSKKAKKGEYSKEALINEYQSFINNFSVDKIKYSKSVYAIKDLKKVISFIDRKIEINQLIENILKGEESEVGEYKLFKDRSSRYPVSEKDLKSLSKDKEDYDRLKEGLGGTELKMKTPAGTFFVGFEKEGKIILRSNISGLKETYQNAFNGQNFEGQQSSCAYLTRESLNKILDYMKDKEEIDLISNIEFFLRKIELKEVKKESKNSSELSKKTKFKNI